MICTLDNAATFFRSEKDSDDLKKQFRNLVLNHEPRIQRVFERPDRLVNVPYSWNLYLAVQNAPKAFHFLELGAKDGTWVAQVDYFAQLWDKQPTLTAVSDQSVPSEKRYAACEALDILPHRTTWLENLDWPLLTDILLVHSPKYLQSCLAYLKLNGLLIVHSDVWICREFQEFEHLYEVGEYQVLRKRA